MTRFARAKGSKSSNARVAEDATSWNEFKRQLERKQIDDSVNASDASAQDTLKRFKQPKPSETTDWADFGTPQVQAGSSANISKKRKTRDVAEDGSEVIKEKVGKKRRDEVKSSTFAKNEVVSVRHTKKDHCQHKEEGTSQVIEEAKFGNHFDSFRDLKARPPSQKERKLNNAKEHFSSSPQISDSGPGNNAGQFRRRKPYVESSTININGITINVSKFDGFDVKSEDAVRLKELRSKMLKEGIPKPEVEKAMKLERRRAEKALAREKKKVNVSDCSLYSHFILS